VFDELNKNKNRSVSASFWSLCSWYHCWIDTLHNQSTHCSLYFGIDGLFVCLLITSHIYNLFNCSTRTRSMLSLKLKQHITPPSLSLSLSLSLSHTLSLVKRVAQIVDVIRKDLKMKVTRIQVDGGVARNDFILQHTADITNCEVVR
jgi:hypothetical protein